MNIKLGSVTNTFIKI